MRAARWLLLATACSPVATETSAPDDAQDAAPSTADAPLDSAGSPLPEPPIIESMATCDHEGVRSVVVPAHDGDDAPRLRLHYRVSPAESPNAPTVVVIPGGPGQAIMHESPTRPFALGAVPYPAVSLLSLDVRGSGCNVYSDDAGPPEQVYSIDRAASDVASIVAAEGLTDYVLYGASFGTAVATAAAHELERRGLPAPKRLVLEGALGRAFPSFDAYFDAFEAEWRRVVPMLGPAWQTAFATEPWPELLFWTREQWGAFASAQLILGDYPGEGHLLDYWLDGLSAEDDAAQAYVAAFMHSVPDFRATAPITATERLFRTVACQELWGGWLPGRELRAGELHAVGEDLCASGLERPWDASRYPSQVPVVIFHGPYDPTTDTEQATAAYDAHAGASRAFVTVPDAAHAPLTLGLAARGCAPAVWAALVSAEPDLGALLEETLSTCTTDAVSVTWE
ncbi:MAG: alpha/beta hydrolase [Myxococcales bacterium]|nr:alpha/beta hydrolase [Myxococcales bacterium]